ncbi:hypothetical protein Hanom_Chr11g00996411 [Helianthus anomalus]
MSFDLGDNFVFDKELARALIEHPSHVFPLPEHFLLLGRVCFSWAQGDRKWPVIRTKRTEMSLRDALKVPNFNSKGVTIDADPKPLVRKRKNETSQILSSDPLPMLKPKKNKRGSSYSGGDVMIELDEHLTGGKFSKEEAALARSVPTPAFPGGFLPVTEVENMEVENPDITSTVLGSSLGPDRFIDGEEDQVSCLPPSWFGPELMSFFRYADVFSDDMEIDPATAEEKFIPDWDIRNNDSVMDELVARTLLFNISTPLDHARS